MMKKFFFLITICLVAFACSSPNKIPDDIIGIDSMKKIVWDMLRAGALSQNLIKKDSVLFKKETLENYQKVLDMYGLTKDEFFKNYNYYLQHPDKNKILMDSLQTYSNNQRLEFFKKTR